MRFRSVELLRKKRAKAAGKAIDRIAPFPEWVRGCQIRTESTFKSFELFPWQEQLYELIQKHSRICIFKVRQVGASEIMSAIMKYRCLSEPGFSGAVFSIGARESSKLQERCKRLRANVTWDVDNKSELRTASGSRIMFLPSTDKGARSLESLSFIFIDECGFIDRIENLYSASVAAQAMAGSSAKLVLASTMPPSGALSWFWRIFAQDCPEDVDIQKRIAALQTGEKPGGFDYWIDEAGWCKVLVHWRAHPVFSQDPDHLARTQVRNKLTTEALEREYNLSIPIAGASLFNPQAVKDCARGGWEEPQPNRLYIAGIDPNFGGSDYFTLLILDITEPIHRLVFEFSSNHNSVDSSIQQCCLFLDRYRPALVACEVNSGGAVVIEQLIKARPHFRIEKFTTTRGSKLVATDRIAVRVEQKLITYPPGWKGIDEMLNFSAAGREAVVGHDDRVLALAIAEAWASQAYPSRTVMSVVQF